MPEEVELFADVVKERGESIEKICQEVQTINKLFEDLALLVHVQAPLLNSIEDHIEKAEERTSKGVAELRKASDYQARSTCILS